MKKLFISFLTILSLVSCSTKQYLVTTRSYPYDGTIRNRITLVKGTPEIKHERSLYILRTNKETYFIFSNPTEIVDVKPFK